ncbi:MAG: hypothetical protein K2L28_09300, partial [Muribaculaceae bacterium]|nr:hypothetical protein [Muribaculaceae bacterium]
MYQNDYNPGQYGGYNTNSAALTSRVSDTMKRVYLKMTLALVVTALTSLWAAGSYSYLSFIVNNHSFMWVLIHAEFGLVFGIAGAINKLA